MAGRDGGKPPLLLPPLALPPGSRLAAPLLVLSGHPFILILCDHGHYWGRWCRRTSSPETCVSSVWVVLGQLLLVLSPQHSAAQGLQALGGFFFLRRTTARKERKGKGNGQRPNERQGGSGWRTRDSCWPINDIPIYITD